MGFKINSILAWFLTFNFINIAWVFFRAKEWDDAIKVLDGMFFGAVILPTPLKEYISIKGVEFGKWSELFYADPQILIWLLAGFFIVLFFKNSMEFKENFKPNMSFLLLTILFFLSIFILYRKSEFIYFNF